MKKGVYLETPYTSIPIYEMEIGLIEVEDTENLKFFVQNEECRAEFEFIINNEGWSISKISGTYLELRMRNRVYSLVDFF